MKKNLLLLCLIFVSTSIVISENGFYSSNYINNLENCSIFMSKSDIEIPQTDIAPLHLQITESISGWKNGKCITNGKIYSKELKQDILTTHCEFDEKQLAQIVKDMEKANKGTFEDYKKVQEKMYAKKSTICTATDLIKAK